MAFFQATGHFKEEIECRTGARLGQGEDSDYYAVNTLYCLLVQRSLTGYYRKNLHYPICISNPGLSREDQTAAVPEKSGDTWTARTGKIN